VTENASFDYVHLLRDDGQSYDEMLVESVQHNERNFEAEGMRGVAHVSATQVKDSPPGKQLWSFESNGNEGMALPDFGLYQESTLPCCSAMWVHEYYSLRNGRHLYTTNGWQEDSSNSFDPGLLRVDQRDDKGVYKGTRFLAFGASYDKGHEEPMIQYGTDHEVKQKILVKGHDYGDSFDVPEMKVVDAKGQLVKDAGSLRSYTIVLTFKEAQEPEAVLKVPVMNDVVRPDLATVPKGYSLTSVR
jgi:hypothetical protein